jgi:hypothetical protein
MKRYFFDIVGHQRSELDYVGRVLPTFDEAYAAAELMAFDLAVKQADEMIGWKVAVSNPDGRKLFSIPVKASYLSAMPMAA